MPEGFQVSAVQKQEMLASRTDEDLIQSVAAGEKVAFDELVKRHKGRLYNYLLRLLRDPTEAEEITQETFVRAYVNAEKYRTIAKFTTWLYTIGTNLVRNRIRKFKSTPRILSLSWSRGEDEEDDRGAIDLPDDGDLPDRSLEKDETHELVAKGIERIPAKYREAFVLREVNHFTYEEIAAITGLKLGTVRSRINRGRGHFRDAMEPMLKRALGDV
jgi:RNA polymerase sigma-70 factor (ECF subfamily)